ncbi:uncharacterized protein LOC127699134 [Mytilus californianus]|uniref:uncharacterized protein LOC127699134 n=1 Tax=Mytilus californianus TaxID=6549 RepID=UPI00224706A7|nr:uncharacterized protein LOC127699134 [Mytilus californianus]
MAFSNSLCKGQIPISCQLCEESNEIKWKCIQCDFLLCTKCQRLHNKVKYTNQHTIIEIKDIASQQQQAKDNPDFSNIPCEIHRENKSHKIKNDLEFQKGSLTKAEASVNVCDAFSALKEEKTARKQSTEPVNTYVKKLPQYIPGKMKTKEALHGELTESDDDHAQEQYEAKVIEQYKTGLKLVEQLICSDDGTLWIGYIAGKILQKIQLSNGLLNIEQEVQVNCAGMAFLPSGDLLISTAESNLKTLCHTTGSKIQSKNNVAPLISGAVHVTQNHKIIVGARKGGPVFQVDGPRQVVVMDIDGKTEQVYDLDNNGKPIFSAPQRITSDNNNNIYVLDCLNKDWSGRIMALDKTNGVRWIYSGHPDINKEQTIKSKDLVATKLNNIIVTDSNHQMIHILNTSGQCIHYINTKDQLNIHLPYSLNIDNTGTLYIGCSRYINEPAIAKIYMVEVSGF